MSKKDEQNFFDMIGSLVLVALVGAIIYRRFGLRISGLPNPAQLPEESLDDSLREVNKRRAAQGLGELQVVESLAGCLSFPFGKFELLTFFDTENAGLVCHRLWGNLDHGKRRQAAQCLIIIVVARTIHANETRP